MSICQSVCKLIIFTYSPFAVYHGKFTVCLPFTVNTIYCLIDRGCEGQTMAIKKMANTAVNSKLLLAVGNPSDDALSQSSFSREGQIIVSLLSLCLMMDFPKANSLQSKICVHMYCFFLPHIILPTFASTVLSRLVFVH